MRLGRDGISGLIGLAVSLGLLPFAFGLPKLPIVPVGPGFYPILVLVFMAIACAVLVVQDVLARPPPAQPPAAEAPTEPPRAYALVLTAFIVVAAYVALLPQIGFRLATVLFVAAFQFAIERPRTLRQWALLSVIAVATSAVTFLVFDQYLSVLLPRGRWTDW
jgi:putative tricarboxylic transport membrane protein